MNYPWKHIFKTASFLLLLWVTAVKKAICTGMLMDLQFGVAKTQ
jgi:hypothetical protein